MVLIAVISEYTASVNKLSLTMLPLGMAKYYPLFTDRESLSTKRLFNN